MKNERKARALIKRGNFIAAVKMIRDTNNTGLKEAKDFCESLKPEPKAIGVSVAVLAALSSEFAHQQAKWPGHQHTVAEWLLILEKLCGDARHAWVTGHGDNQALHEIRQITATGAACMEQCGTPLRGEPFTPAKYPK